MSKKKVSKNLAVKNDNAISTEFKNMFDQSLVQNESKVDTEDILISKIAVVQKMSKAVDEGAVVGSYVDSVEGNELIEKGGSLDLFFFGYHKLIQEFKVEGNEKTYLRTVNYDKNLAFDEETNEGTIHRDTCIRFYALSVEDVLDGMAFPYIVEFKRTSRNAGQKLATQIAKMSSILGVPSYAKVFSLSAKEQQKDEHKYFVKEVSIGRDINADELNAVELWVSQVQKRQAEGTIKTDETDEGEAINKQADVVDGEVRQGSQY